MPDEGVTVEGVDVEGLREYLDDRDVVFAVLFGSRVSGEADESSDVDIALRFPEGIHDRERFRRRNRIDADLQEYANGFVDVSDIDALPTPVAHAALQEGVVLTGDERAVEAYRDEVAAEYESTAAERERRRRELIDRLARGDV
jgi:predicted nucleotidyltransferase